MISHQSQAVWELCRQGYPILADEAEIRWRSGQTYQPDLQVRIPRILRALIDTCNYEVTVRHNDPSLD